jgi:hypothetical protein
MFNTSEQDPAAAEKRRMGRRRLIVQDYPSMRDLPDVSLADLCEQHFVQVERLGEFGLSTLHHYFFSRMKHHHGEENLRKRPQISLRPADQFQLAEGFEQRRQLLMNLYRLFHSPMRLR